MRFDTNTHTEEKVMQRQSRERFEDAGLKEDWSDVATNHGMSAATISGKRKGMDSPQGLQREYGPTNTTILHN